MESTSPPLSASMADQYPLFDAGDLVVSLRHIDAVFVLDPGTREVKWSAHEPFMRQHDPDFIGEGWISVFDNRNEATSRGVRALMNHAQGTLVELESWSLDRTCHNQGGVLPMPGGALLTCSNSDEVSAFRSGEELPAWTMLATCGAGSGSTSVRAYPVFIE